MENMSPKIDKRKAEWTLQHSEIFRLEKFFSLLVQEKEYLELNVDVHYTISIGVGFGFALGLCTKGWV